MEKSLKHKAVSFALIATLAFSGAALVLPKSVSARAETARSEYTVTLDAGEGVLSQTTVTLDADGKLPILPTPTREGWEFVGWFDQAVTENFWGDESAENTAAADDYITLKNAYSDYAYVLYDGVVTPTAELSLDGNRGWKELTFNYVCATNGVKARVGYGTDAKTLYAMYKAKRHTVYWHLNGWLNDYGDAKHRTLPEHGGYFVEYELDKFPSLSWANHEFLGWYTDPECTEEYTFNQVGAYTINAQKVTEDIHLYAKWTALSAFDGEIRVNKPSSLIEPYGTFTVTCNYTLGASRDMPVITQWESGMPDAIALVSYDVASASAVFEFKDASAFKNGNKQVTLYVTVDGKKYTAADITVGHSWSGIVSYKSPTCTEGGYTEYGCKFCDATKTVTHAADGHRLVTTVHPATCTEDAYAEIYCIACVYYEIKISENSKLGHNLITHTEANCFGTTTVTTCTECGLTETTFDGSAVVHNWDWIYTVDKAATCTENGEKSIHCRGCDAKRDMGIIPASGKHIWSEWVVKAEPTTEQTGLKSHACKLCGKTEEAEIPALPEEPKEPEITEPEEPKVTEPKEPEIEQPDTEEPDGNETEVEQPEPEEPEAIEPDETETTESDGEENTTAAAVAASSTPNNNAKAQAVKENQATSQAWVIAVTVAAAALLAIGLTVVFIKRRTMGKIK